MNDERPGNPANGGPAPRERATAESRGPGHNDQLSRLLVANVRSRPYRVFSITWNNPPDTWDDHVSSLSDEIQYGVFGVETAPTTGTVHLQGAIRLRKPARAAAVRKLFPGCHIEPARAPVALFEYCKKEGKFREYGKLLKQGERTDLTEFYAGIRAGNPVASLFEDFPQQTLQYLGNIERIRLRFGQSDREAPRVWWIYGSTGVGKTKYVYDREPQVWASSDNLKWFDGYESHEAVLFDDFRARDVSYAFLLRLLDRYPLNVPIKGGFVPWVPKRIYITCPLSPEEAFENELHDKDPLAQLTRRIHNIVHLQ